MSDSEFVNTIELTDNGSNYLGKFYSSICDSIAIGAKLPPLRVATLKIHTEPPAAEVMHWKDEPEECHGSNGCRII